MAVSPITAIPLEQDPNSNEYDIMLPTRSHDDGTPIVVSYDKSIPMERAMEDINGAFQRNSADTQVDQLQGGSEYVLNKMTKEDYLQWEKDKSKFDEPYDVSLTDTLLHAAKDLGRGMLDTGIQLATGIIEPDQRKAARALLNATEGFMIGNERLGMLVQLGYHAGKKLVLPNMTDYRDDAAYDAFRKQHELVDIASKRASGQLLTEGAPSPIFGNVIKDMGLAIEDPTRKAMPEDVRAANSISNFLDATMFLGGVGFLEKMAAAPLVSRIASKLVPSAIVNEMLPKLAFRGMAATGTTLDFVSRKAIDAISGIVTSVSEGAVSSSAKQVANITSRTLLYGADIYATGGSLVFASLGGKALRAAGEIGSAVTTGMVEGSVREALAGLAENTTKAATVRRMARLAAQLAPPDTFMNTMKHFADSAVNAATLMGGISAMQSYALNDDPIHGFAEGFAGGLGVGMVGGIHGVAKELLGSTKNRVAQAFKKDISSRPLTQTLSYTSPTGESVQVPIVDLQGRMNLLNHPDLTWNQKEMILAISQATEKAGNKFIFHDGKNETTEALDKLGLIGGDAVHIRRQGDGRSIIIVNPMSEGFSPADVVQEFFHSNFSDTVAKETFTKLTESLGAEDPNIVVKELADFSKKYTDLLRRNDPQVGGAKADDFDNRINQALDPATSLEDKINILSPIIDEYISNYAGAKLAGAKAHDIMPPKIKSTFDRIWDKVTSDVLSALDFSKQGLSKDPIYGHFFDEKGKLGMQPEMSSVINKILDAAAEGKQSIAPKDTFDGTSYFHVVKDKPFISIEDMVDGEWTKTRAEKQKILGEWFKQASIIASADPTAVEAVHTPDMAERGVMHGNIKEGDPVIFSQSLSDDALIQMARIQVNGKRVFSADQEAGLLAVNKAVKERRVIGIDAWHDIGRTSGSRQDRYYGRANRTILPISIQQTKTGGLTLNFLDVGRAWSLAKRMSESFPEVRKELASKNIRSLHDYLPYLQEYFNNYSTGSPIPAKDLPGFSETMRDIIYNSMNIRNRGEKSKYHLSDIGKFKNEPTFKANMFGDRYEEVAIGGNKVRMERNSVSLGSIRMDRILGVSDFTRNGEAVDINYNPHDVTGFVRANFAARSTTRERLGNSEVVTDQMNGKRIIISEKGRATLFDGDKKVTYASEEDAVNAANRDSVQFAARKKDRNKYTSRSKPSAGNEAEHADTKKKLESLINQRREGKIPESKKRETLAEIKFLEQRLKQLSDSYHTRGNDAGDQGFKDDPLISAIIEYGRIMTPSEVLRRYGKDSSEIAQYDYFNNTNYSTDNYFSSPTHNKIFSPDGKLPDDLFHELSFEDVGYSAKVPEIVDLKPDEVFDLIKSKSQSASEGQLTGSRQEREAKVIQTAADSMTSGRGRAVSLRDLEIGEEFKIGNQYIVRVNDSGEVRIGITGDFEYGVRFDVYNGRQTAGHAPGEERLASFILPFEGEHSAIYIPTGEEKKAPRKKAEIKTGPEAMPATISKSATSPLRGREDMFGEPVPVIPSVDPYAPVISKDTHLETVNEYAIKRVAELDEINAKFELESQKILQQLGEIDLSAIRGTETEGRFQLGNEPSQMIGARGFAPDELKVKQGQADSVREFRKKQLKDIGDSMAAIKKEKQETQKLINLFVEPPQQIPFSEAKQAARERVERVYADNSQATHKERSLGINLSLRNEHIISPDQLRMANEMLRGKHGADSYEAQLQQTREYLLNVIDGNDSYIVPPKEGLEPAVKFTPEEAQAFLDSQQEFSQAQAREESQAIKDRRAAEALVKKKKSELSRKPITEMSKEEISMLTQDQLDRRLKALEEKSKEQHAAEKHRINLYALEDLAERIRKRGGTGDKKLDAQLNPGYIRNINTPGEAFRLGQKLAAISVSRFEDYANSKIAKANEPVEMKTPTEFTVEQRPGESYADYILRKSEIRKAAIGSLTAPELDKKFPVPQYLQVQRPMLKNPLEAETGTRTQASLFGEGAPAFNLNDWRFGGRRATEPLPEPVNTPTSSLTKRNPLVISDFEVVREPKSSAKKAKIEKPTFNMEDFGFTKTKKVESETAPESRVPAIEYSEPKAETKAESELTKAIEAEKTDHDITPGFTSKKGVEVNDPALPKGVKVILSPMKTYRIYGGTGAVVGATKSYDEAFKIAMKQVKQRRQNAAR